VVQLSEIQEIAIACKIPQESIPGVLEFYHSFGVFFYYSDIPSLNQKVIANPHWLIKMIGSLLSLEGLQPKVGTPSMWSTLHKYGILVKKLVDAVLKKQKYLSPSEITALLQSFLIIAEMNTRSKKHSFKGKEYFVPSILKPREILKTRKICDYSAEPLYLTFSTNYLPPGFFTRFVALLSQNALFTIIFGDKMCRNKIQFMYGVANHKNDEISITENVDSVKVDIIRLSPSIRSFQKSSLSDFQESCEKLLDIFVNSSVEVLKWLPDIEMNVALQCQNCRIAEPHLAQIPAILKSGIVILCQMEEQFSPSEPQEFWVSIMKVMTYFFTKYYSIKQIHYCVFRLTIKRKLHYMLLQI